jgi:multiple sugar transport system permease protein
MTTDAARLSGPAPSPPDKPSLITRLRRRQWFPYLMTIPALLVVLAVVVFPMLYALFVSFTPFHLLRPDTTSAFVPSEMFDNYARLARDDVFWRSLRNTIIFMLVTVNASLLIGFGMALMMARMTFMVGPARTLLMIPMMFAPVLIGFQFAWFFNATVGLVNNALLTLRVISEPIPFLIDEPSGMISLMLASIWMTVPVVTIILLAGRLSLPEELYDAASVDGASLQQKLRHITIPQMRPFFVIVMLLLSLDIARAYDIVRIMTDGGPAHRTELIWTYGGQLAIRNSQFGLASAMSMTGVFLGVFFTFYLFRQMMKVRKDLG